MATDHWPLNWHRVDLRGPRTIQKRQNTRRTHQLRGTFFEREKASMPRRVASRRFASRQQLSWYIPRGATPGLLLLAAYTYIDMCAHTYAVYVSTVQFNWSSGTRASGTWQKHISSYRSALAVLKWTRGEVGKWPRGAGSVTLSHDVSHSVSRLAIIRSINVAMSTSASCNMNFGLVPLLHNWPDLNLWLGGHWFNWFNWI